MCIDARFGLIHQKTGLHGSGRLWAERGEPSSPINDNRRSLPGRSEERSAITPQISDPAYHFFDL